MKTFCLIILPILLILLAFCFFVVKGREQKNHRVIRVLLVFTFATIAFYMLFLISDENIFAAHIFRNLYLISLAWQVLFFFQFVRKYTNARKVTKIIELILGVGTFVQTMSFLANIQWKHVFYLTKVYDSSRHTYFFITNYHTFGYYMIGMNYLVLFATLLLLIVKFVNTSRYYRSMYSELFVQICLLMVISLVSIFYRIDVDFTVPFYGLVALTVCYFSLYATPKKMIMDMVFNVVRDLDASIYCLDQNFRCIYHNKRALDVFATEEEAFKLAAEKQSREWIERKGDTLRDREKWTQEVMTVCGKRTFEIEFSKLLDERKHCVGYYFCLTDITLLLESEMKEQFRQTHDELTGVYSREAFFARAEEIIRRDSSKKRYMICTNIKNFKLVNDLFGEELGDQVLKDQAKMLQRADYPDCIHGRLAADRFAMLIDQKNFNPELAAKNTSQLQYLVNDSNYKIPIIIGVYPIENAFESAKVMCDKASMALSTIVEDYGEKLFAFYEEGMMENLVREKWVTSDFDRAMEAGEFFMVLQPQVDVDKALIGAEALVRWEHPEYGMVSPDEFIPIVEKSGYIYKLDRFIWEEAVKRLKFWKEMGWNKLNISVNICPKDFYYTDIYQEFTSLVEKYDVSPGNLNLEITESVMMQDVDKHMKVLTALKKYGFQVEIDDFGSGFSSLNQLKNMPVDILKMDMGFLVDANYSERSNTIIATIISMAKSLKMQVIMEGIENAEQLKMLSLMGCEMFQGFFISRPITVAEFEQQIRLGIYQNVE